MKMFPVFFLIFACTACSGQVSDALETSFTRSYEFEKTRNFDSAVAVLKRNYMPESYEVNLRLGWLYYNNALYTESQWYYKKAIALRPRSVEARLGIVLPESALGNWDQ